MSHEDYQKGLNGIGGGSGMDYLKGVNERERDRAAAKPQPPPTSTLSPPSYEPPGSDFGRTDPAFGSARTTAPAMPETLRSMAKSGAGLLLVLFVAYTLLISHAWTWAQMIIGGAAAAALGAVAGAALYIAIRILMVVLRIAGVLLLVGVALHLLGVLDLAAVLSRIGRALGV